MRMRLPAAFNVDVLEMPRMMHFKQPEPQFVPRLITTGYERTNNALSYFFRMTELIYQLTQLGQSD
jgi:hypothetical protein